VNPRAAALIVLAGVVLFALVVWSIRRNAGVRRREFRRVTRDRDRLLAVLDRIEAAANLFSDLDSVLAEQVRHIIRTDANRSELPR
jgi:hypothetical protein